MKEPMNMRALGECPGWVVDENGRMRHVTAWNPEGIWPEHAPAIAAAQRLEWKAKRLAELEAEREAALNHEVGLFNTLRDKDLIPPKPSAWGPLERLRNDATKDPQRDVLVRERGSKWVGSLRIGLADDDPKWEYAEIPQ